jgi:VWFA-related protein
MLNSMHKRLAMVGTAWLALTVLASGQQPPSQTPPPAQTPAPVFKSGVELVRLDVSVLDSRRLPVKGLTINDFKVLENGKPQKISTFSEVEVPEPVVPTTDWMKDVAMDIKRNDDMNDRRLILIVMDDAMISSTSLHSVASVKTAAHAIVDQMGPADLAAVVYTADSRNQQEFTSDRAKLLGAIDRFAGGFGGDQELFERYSVGALVRASEILAEIPQRRKALFYISTGVAMDLNAIARPTSAGREGTGGDPTGRAAWIKDQMNEVFRQAQLANVNIHAIDPSSLDGLAGSGVFDPHKDFLFSVSENTGGFPIINRSDYAEAIAQVFLENSSYYLLGYEPVIPDDGKFRRLEVITNQPGLTVRARSGYTAPDAVKSVKSSAGAKAAPSPLWKAISGLMPVGDLPLQVTAAPFAAVGSRVNGKIVPPKAGEATVAVALGIVQDVVTGEEHKVEHIDFLIDAFGQDGTSKSVHGLKADVTFKPNVTGKVGYEVLTRIDLKPGRYQLRLSAHLPSEDLSGSIYYDVDVPDFSKGALAMSGAMISVAPALVAAPRDRLADLLPIVPTTNRYFNAKADQVSAFVSVYQPKGTVKPIDLTARITDSSGAEIITRPVTLPVAAFGGDRRSAGYRFTVPVANLKPGQYLLTFEAVLGKDKVRRDVRFVVH